MITGHQLTIYATFVRAAPRAQTDLAEVTIDAAVAERLFDENLSYSTTNHAPAPAPVPKQSQQSWWDENDREDSHLHL